MNIPLQHLLAGQTERFTAAEVHVLMWMVYHANARTGETFASLPRLAMLTRYHERHVQLTQQGLRRKGVLVRVGGGRGKGNFTKYRIQLEPVAVYTPAAPASPADLGRYGQRVDDEDWDAMEDVPKNIWDAMGEDLGRYPSKFGTLSDAAYKEEETNEETSEETNPSAVEVPVAVHAPAAPERQPQPRRQKQPQRPACEGKSQDADGWTLTSGGKPGAKRAQDPRHTPFRDAIRRYWDHANQASGLPCPWGPADAGQLANLLRSSPGLDLATFQRLLTNRFRSAGVAHGSPPHTWLPTVTMYTTPLTQYNRTMEAKDGTGTGNKSQDKTNANVAAAKLMLERRRAREAAAAHG